MTYNAAIRRKQGGNILEVAAGGRIDATPIVSWFTDFLGDQIEDEMLAGVGSGSGNAVALSTGVNGRVEIKTSSANAAIGENGSSIGLGALNWRANQGGLMMEARVQIDNIASVLLFVGFTDALGSTVEAPIFLNSADIDSDADDACGVLFDTNGTTAQWAHGGVKATVDTLPAYLGSAPAAATWYKVRVEVSAAGAVQGYINDVPIPGGPIANAVTVTAPLVPIIFAANRTGSVRNVLVDYLHVQANRL
jgi:hypothetical protein